MTPILLILFGIVVIGITIWDISREQADMLFWMDCAWWDVNKTDNPWLYRIAITVQLLGGLILIGVGAIWLIYFGRG